MESCIMVNRSCSYNNITQPVTNCKHATFDSEKTALLQSPFLQNSFVDSLVNFGQPTCPLVAQMVYSILLYISICVRYVTKIVQP